MINLRSEVIEARKRLLWRIFGFDIECHQQVVVVYPVDVVLGKAVLQIGRPFRPFRTVITSIENDDTHADKQQDVCEIVHQSNITVLVVFHPLVYACVVLVGWRIAVELGTRGMSNALR